MGLNLNDRSKFIADINVTPLVDVMLVLLVIFMITAPLMLNAIKLQVPKTKEVNIINLTTKQVVLSLTKQGDFFIGKNKIAKGKILAKLKNKFSKTKNKTLFLRADYEISYGKVAKLMSFLKNGGISTIALVTEIEKS
ncbi:MAG: protein TolR [Epsilonproteobacteria bacterium]|nr:MAG: protein TolR [Campylobacterota bacterium]RLA64882.1 MAG: protein TolR [Campylobacterota bacterium]